MHTAPGAFGDSTVEWVCSEEDDKAVVDGICYQGPGRGFDFEAGIRIQVGAALEVLGPGEVAIPSPPVWASADADQAELTWVDAALALSMPTQAHPSH